MARLLCFAFNNEGGTDQQVMPTLPIESRR